MRVVTIVGTRPEMIRLSLIIQKLDKLATKHVLVHTGQNFDKQLKDVFFDELGIRQPDYMLGHQATSFGEQLGWTLRDVEAVLTAEQPDAILVLGDTNSALCAMLGARKQIPVYHMEAGNRCYDNTVPEETNRKIIDSISQFNLPYTPGSRENLLREGVHPQRIWVSGNPIYEVLNHFESEIENSNALQDLGVSPRGYFLVTAHRAENVDNQERARAIFGALEEVGELWDVPVIVSVHPRTRERLKEFHIEPSERLKLLNPLGFFDFVKLQKYAKCVFTDSGTVQEESCLFQVPSVTMRQSTERPETILCGSNILAGVHHEHIVECTKLALQKRDPWPIPEGYDDPNVSSKVVQFILGGVTYV